MIFRFSKQKNQFLSLAFVVFLSVVVEKIAYFGFTPNYSFWVFSRAGITRMLSHDVFQYRILSQYFLFGTDHFLGYFMPDEKADPRILLLDPKGSERLYLAYYYLNTFFLALTAVLLLLILDLKKAFRINAAEKLILLVVMVMTMGLSQFVVCYYDNSSYFFQVLIEYVLLRFMERHYWATIVGVGLLVVLSTLNRESSALSVAIVAVILIGRFGPKENILMGIVGIGGCFLLTYIGLRVFIVDPVHGIFVNELAGRIFADVNLYGLLFWILFCYFAFVMADSVDNRWMIGAYFLFSAPYIVTCLINGVLWEVRLYIPLLLGSLLLSRLDVSHYVYNYSHFHKSLRAR